MCTSRYFWIQIVCRVMTFFKWYVGQTCYLISWFWVHYFFVGADIFNNLCSRWFEITLGGKQFMKIWRYSTTSCCATIATRITSLAVYCFIRPMTVDDCLWCIESCRSKNSRRRTRINRWMRTIQYYYIITCNEIKTIKSNNTVENKIGSPFEIFFAHNIKPVNGDVGPKITEHNNNIIITSIVEHLPPKLHKGVHRLYAFLHLYFCEMIWNEIWNNRGLHRIRWRLLLLL